MPQQARTNKQRLRVWMRDIIVPQREPRKDLALSPRSENDSVAARDRRILEFPLSTSSETVAEILKAEGTFTIPSTLSNSVSSLLSPCHAFLARSSHTF